MKNSKIVDFNNLSTGSICSPNHFGNLKALNDKVLDFCVSATCKRK